MWRNCSWRGGADPNARTEGGWTPLMGAVRSGRADLVKLLLDKGADVNAEGMNTGTALGLAEERRNLREIAELLKEKGAVASVGPRYRMGGVPPLRAVSGTPAPMGPNQSIRVDAQEIRIRLRHSSYSVDAVFYFFNAGEATTESLGFPKSASEGWNFERFRAWVDGRKIEVSEEHDPARSHTSHDENSGSDLRWFVAPVTFPGNGGTTIRVSYKAPYRFDPIGWGQYRSMRVLYYSWLASWRCTDRVGGTVFIIDGADIGGRERFRVDLVPGARWQDVSTENAVRLTARDYQFYGDRLTIARPLLR